VKDTIIYYVFRYAHLILVAFWIVLLAGSWIQSRREAHKEISE
jgi:hypothetical protein